MSLEKKNKDLLTGSLWRNILMFTLPIALSGMLQLVFNAADLIVVGKFDRVSGSLAQAAIGSTGSIGTQTLEVVDLNPDIKVSALTANNNAELMERQARKYKPEKITGMYLWIKK